MKSRIQMKNMLHQEAFLFIMAGLMIKKSLLTGLFYLFAFSASAQETVPSTMPHNAALIEGGAPTALPAEGATQAPTIDANALVAKADAIRVPKGSYEFDAIITNFEGQDKKSENGYKAYVKNLDLSLVAYTLPQTERGKSVLMMGDDLWIYLPNVKKPVRIPLQQRLTGNVSNGDVTRLNFANDYNAVAAGEATVETSTGPVETYVLDLTAKSESKTYNKIKYWIAKTDSKPVKAEYFTVSGQSLKTCTFEDFRNEAGGVRPMKLTFRDSVNTNNSSTLVFSNMTTKTLPDNMFTKDYMKTLE